MRIFQFSQNSEKNMDGKMFVSNYERPYSFYTRPPLPPPPPPPQTPATTSRQSHVFNLNYKVSPTVLLIIIILAIIFFLSGLIHLLVRYLMRPVDRDPDEFDNVTALQGQLQQLFHLHDSGVDQSFIDTLPVFSYKSITGVKDPFDCAVCLCEFRGEDKLRLLPKCSHAFHMDCIDTWLLSHSTCPLCRGSLLSDFTPNNTCSPIVLVLESGSVETSRESVSSDPPNSSSIQRVNSHLSNKDFEVDKGEVVKEDDDKEKVVTIKLGKYKNVDGGGESSSEQTIDGRRCFSMGSFEYVMNENSNLQVPIRTQMKKQASKKSSLPITPSHRPAMSECGGDSRIDFKGIEVLGGGSSGGGGGNGKSKRESFSVSKIWLRGKKQKANSTIGAAIGRSSRGSFSFRFDGSKEHIRASSEMDIGRWDDDQEMQMRQWLDPPQLEASNPPSFARRSLFCLMGWQQIKVVHSSSSTNV
ncbi:putative transcription factor C2H2 family [Helianthus annuus]|uniref:RING-type E3 ubiquitin transferase n=3 Tax=Helianthus annuus TaxID=4232 RepID=A0A9K3I2Y1_HELAN|nr:RING-H2 finger protein ATL13 isoform X1 [Helianthus annuus]KAF5789459.1 putative transcription factor C2H2 family [Helianthus annuus]KAJ0532778.1 putative transcription factor C2H2 family [Helianthus annuus]KAJ0710339.1 putative transcription factor C2H2 family [Helianthus annuus]KAJ0891761.1 putative transcription factor C2H2 family [Helianthus annuus]